MRRKLTLLIDDENMAKVERVSNETGISFSEYVNQVIEEVPVLCMGDEKTLADRFISLMDSIESGKLEEVKKEVEELCVLLDILLDKTTPKKVWKL